MAAGYSDLQEAPAPARLAALANAVRPDSAVESVTRLEGGVDNGMHVLALRHTSGAQQRVVLRRYGDEQSVAPVDRATREWKLLGLLEAAAVAAPRRLVEDSDGNLSGTPAIITTWIPGVPESNPDAVADWHEQFAAALHDLHCVDLSVHDAAFLGPSPDPAARVLKRTEPPSRIAEHPLGPRLWKALRAAAAQVEPEPQRLLHGDVWHGNTLWLDGRLQTLVDWDQAALGDSANDVGNLWMELTLAGRPAAADHFVDVYRALARDRLANLHFYALLALVRPMPDAATFLSASPDAAETVRQNLARAIHSALEGTPASARA